MSIDEYIASFPKAAQTLLKQVRATIRKAAPEAVETISYGMPAYKVNGKPLVYFACFKNHIGFYATPTGHAAFAEELSIYKQGKGSVQFPLNKPVPFDLIKRIVLFRLQDQPEKAAKSSNRRTCKNGHVYYKSSDCPTCPVCEQNRKPGNGFLALLSAPAKRALENNGISSLKQLSRFTEADILRFHGMGKASIPKLRAALTEKGLYFKK